MSTLPSTAGSGPADPATVGRVALIVNRQSLILDHSPCDLVADSGSPGSRLAGLPFAGLVHPADTVGGHQLLERVFSGPEPVGSAMLRVRSGDGYRAMVVTAFRFEGREMASVVMEPAPAPAVDPSAQRVAELEEALARVGAEVEMILDRQNRRRQDVPPLTRNLSMRQRRIVELLCDGYRVPRIAAEFYVSQSTVRNHLLVLFRKFGVSSQSELIELLRDGRAAG